MSKDLAQLLAVYELSVPAQCITVELQNKEINHSLLGA